jgi:hypothetical protein
MVKVIIPSGHWRTLNAGVVQTTIQLIRQANEFLDYPAPVRLDKDIACHKARNKRRAAARFRARELRRQSRASAPAPADVPALAAGTPVSPGQDAIWFCCGKLAKGEHHLICPRHPKNINLGNDKIMAAIHEIARN